MSGERKLLGKSPNVKTKNSDPLTYQSKSDTYHVSGLQTSNVSKKQNQRSERFHANTNEDKRCFAQTSKKQGSDGASASSQVVSRKSTDLGSVFRPGPRKLSTKNLDYDSFLGFNFEKTNNQKRLLQFDNCYYGYESRSPKLNFSRCPSYNKEQFLLANCQFVIKQGLDCKAHLSDPDLPVDWDFIEEVRLSQIESPSCPICLYSPVAAQITRCGHVFCWPCALHYLSLSDKPWRKCPICFESMYKSQLRSVKPFIVAGNDSCVDAQKRAPFTRYAVGSTILFRLMRRFKGSNIVLPADDQQRHQLLHCTDKNARFAKLLLTSENYTKSSILDRERKELTDLLEREKDTPESCFILEALAALNDRELQLLSNSGASSGICDSENVPTNPSYGFQTATHRQDNVTSTVQKDVNFSCIDDSSEQRKSYYFYQADDGQQVFLHPVNVHCLLREYGSLEHAPYFVQGNVIQIENYTMGSEVRRHYRYLGHLPTTCVFSLIEITFENSSDSPGVVSSETLAYFSSEFSKRDRARKAKQENEQRLQKKCQRWEKAMLLSTASRPLSGFSNDSDDFPVSTIVQSAQQEIEASLLSHPALTNNSISICGKSLSQMIERSMLSGDDVAVTSLSSSSSTQSVDRHLGDDTSSMQSATPSFAQMLRCGKLKSPAVASNQSLSSFVAKTDEDQEYVPTALNQYRNNFGDALKAAFDNLMVEKFENQDQAGNKKNNVVGSTNGGRKKDKKRNKGKILFAI